jgi:adenosylhomocysteine nucleosidase
LIGAGLAGAVSNDLAVGDLLLARSIRDRDGESPAPDAQLLSRGLAAEGARAGALLTLERPAVGSAERASLAALLDGSDASAAVDMESAAWARVASEREIPFLVVRSISDTAQEDLPEYLGQCVGSDGRIRRTAVLRHALARPWTVKPLIQMHRRMRLCAERLADFLEKYLSEEI